MQLHLRTATCICLILLLNNDNILAQYREVHKVCINMINFYFINSYSRKQHTYFNKIVNIWYFVKSVKCILRFKLFLSNVVLDEKLAPAFRIYLYGLTSFYVPHINPDPPFS